MKAIRKTLHSPPFALALFAALLLGAVQPAAQASTLAMSLTGAGATFPCARGHGSDTRGFQIGTVACAVDRVLADCTIARIADRPGVQGRPLLARFAFPPAFIPALTSRRPFGYAPRPALSFIFEARSDFTRQKRGL